jgi:hypothetical protein
VAFCPAPPLLLPAVSGRAADGTAELRGACLAAIAAMLAPVPDIVVVVGAAPAGARFGAGDVGSLRGLGVGLSISFAGPPASGRAAVPLPHTIGAWLLDQAGCTAVRVGVAPDLFAEAIDTEGRVAVLVMGDGSARRTTSSPGWWDPAGEPFDEAVAAALGAGDADALAGLDPAEGERLLAEGVPAWRAVGAALAGREITGRLRLHAAPFGVGYLVADWVVR